MTVSDSRILILGLGNPILGDDGVGWHIAENLQSNLYKVNNPTNIEIDFLSVGGLSLMERMVGYDCTILIDAMKSGVSPKGSVGCFSLDEIPNRASGHLSSSHDTSLQNAIAMGRTMGVHLPEDIIVVAVEAENVYEFSELLSPAVENAVPQAVDLVIHLLAKMNS